MTYVGLINHVAQARLIGMLAINKGRELTFKKHVSLQRLDLGTVITLNYHFYQKEKGCAKGG